MCNTLKGWEHWDVVQSASSFPSLLLGHPFLGQLRRLWLDGKWKAFLIGCSDSFKHHSTEWSHALVWGYHVIIVHYQLITTQKLFLPPCYALSINSSLFPPFLPPLLPPFLPPLLPPTSHLTTFHPFTLLHHFIFHQSHPPHPLFPPVSSTFHQFFILQVHPFLTYSSHTPPLPHPMFILPFPSTPPPPFHLPISHPPPPPFSIFTATVVGLFPPLIPTTSPFITTPNAPSPNLSLIVSLGDQNKAFWSDFWAIFFLY